LIVDFKDWFSELGANAIKRKKATALKTGKEQKWTRKTKNKEIKEKFTNEGRLIKDIKPRSSNDKKAGEWLYDLIWREFDSNNNFIGVKLVMEIELSDMKERGLMYDFNKILQSDAEYKVFVFQQETKAESTKLLAKLKNSSEMYKNKVKSDFLLCCWCWETGTFLFEDFIRP
jgi:hypothetical protein